METPHIKSRSEILPSESMMSPNSRRIGSQPHASGVLVKVKRSQIQTEIGFSKTCINAHNPTSDPRFATFEELIIK
jgi:hypothetical protein